MEKEIFVRIKEILVDMFGIDEQKITSDKAFVRDLDLDSLDMVEMVMALENATGLQIPDEDAEKLITVQDVIDYISRELQ